MTKIYINEKGRPMHNPKWPKSEDYVVVCDGGQHGHFEDEMYQKALEKAKAEAIPFDLDHFPTRDAIRVNIPLNVPKGSYFFDADIEVEVGWQYKVNGLWRDASEENCWKYSNERGCETRQVARIKKQESGVSSAPEKQRCEYELAVEKYFGLVNWPIDEPIEEGSDYTHLVNLLAMFDQEKTEDMQRENAELKAKLEKAED